MGISALGALIAIALAFLAQSPRLLTRLSMTDRRLDLRARTLTGYGLALLLLAMGFFVAGVPLGASTAPTADTEPTADVLADDGSLDATTPVTDTVSNGGSQSGAMIGLPTRAETTEATNGLPTVDLTAVATITGTIEASTPDAPTDAAPEATPTAEPTDTPFPTATPTLTPSPTPTPTPIIGPTARVNEETSTLPVRQLPGGPVVAGLVRGDTVLLLSGHAFHTGEVWQEVSTLQGIIGWVPQRFLEFSEEEG
jgi:hypothetical protein